MIVSFEHKFIFLANVKTASTAIEYALRDRCQMTAIRSEWGKHVSLSYLEAHHSGIFEVMPREDYLVFGVMRDPLDWMHSLYRSHKLSQFEGSPIDTSGMSFGQFLERWCQENEVQTRDQHSIFKNLKGEIDADFIIRYDHLDEDFDHVTRHIGLSGCTLEHLNASSEPSRLDIVAPADVAFLYQRYSIDRNLLHEHGGKLRTGRRIDVDHARAIEADAVETGSGVIERWHANTMFRPITRDDVIWAFRMLLGRDPESSDAVESHMFCRDRQELRSHIMKSEEFRNIIGHVSDMK